MNNYKRALINKERFSVSFCQVAENYGYKTVGSFEKALRRARSHGVKWYYGTSHIRCGRLLKEIERFQASYS
jgi:hypothetical protein